MSPSFSTKVLLFSGLSLLQISKNFVDLAQQVSALALTRGTGMSKCKTALVLESFQEIPSVSEQNSEDLQQNHDPAEAGAGNANSPSVCETTELATGRTSSNLNEAGMPDSYAKMLEISDTKVLEFMNTANLLHRERAYLLRKKLLIDLSLNFVDAERLSVPEGGQDAAFEIAEDGAQGTSAASTLVRAQRWKTVGDLKTWLASVRGKSKFFIDVFLLGTENKLEDTQTLSQIGEASNNTGPVNLFVLERVFSKDASVQDFLEQYSTRLKNFTEVESFTADQVVQKNEVTVRIERADIDSTTNTKTSSDKDSSSFFEFTFVRERTSDLMPGERVDNWDKMYIVFGGRKNHVIYYDVSDDSWWHKEEKHIMCEDAEEDVSFKNNIGFLARRRNARNHSCTLRIAGLGEMTWAKLFTTYLIYSSFESSTYSGDFSIFPGHAKELLIPEWKDFAIEFHNESAGAPSLDLEPIPDSQRLITKNEAGDVKIYDSDRAYFEEVEKKVGGNWNGLRIADVTFKQT